MSSSDGISIHNNTICQNDGDGLTIVSSSNITVRNNTCCSNVEAGLILSSSSNITVSDCYLADNSWYGLGIYGTDSADNRIWNNTFYHNRGSGDTYNPSAVQAFDEGVRNWWNSSDGYGNFWSDWTGPDGDGDGIVDVPYEVLGGAGAKDYYPLTTPQAPIPEFGMMPLVVMIMLVAIVLTKKVRRRKAP
jgi:parallel beta-helix repeat protein